MVPYRCVPVPVNKSRRKSPLRQAFGPTASTLQRFNRQGIEPAGDDVLFKLAVPRLRVELGKPFAKRSKVLTRETLDGAFDIVNRARTTILSPRSRTAKSGTTH